MARRKSEYRVFNGRQYVYQYTTKTKSGALASKKTLKGEGKAVRITKTSKGYAVWARKPM